MTSVFLFDHMKLRHLTAVDVRCRDFLWFRKKKKKEQIEGGTTIYSFKG